MSALLPACGLFWGCTASPTTATTTPTLVIPTTTTSVQPVAEIRYVGRFPAGLHEYRRYEPVLPVTHRGHFRQRRIDARSSTPTYAVSGGFTATSGLSGSVSGTLDGTPERGVFHRRVVNNPERWVRRPAQLLGELTQERLDWTPGHRHRQLRRRESVQLAVNLPASPSPPSSTTSAVTSTTTSATSTSTVPPTSTTSTTSSGPSSSTTSSSTTSVVTSTTTVSTTTVASTRCPLGAMYCPTADQFRLSSTPSLRIR